MAEKILIVDDDVDSLKLIGLMLKRQGYDVTVADSGGKALSKADAETPSLIILDVMMPDMNGLDVCRRLRANPKTANIPIIMFTAKTLIDDKVKGFEAGADDYLTKPTHPAELANRVKSVLQRKVDTKNTGSAPAQSAQTAPALVSSKSAKLGMLIGVLGVKGGVGTTTVAMNVAASLLRSDENPVLADLRLGIGGMGLMLGQDDDGMSRLLRSGNISDTSVNDAIVTYDSGLRGLFSASNPHDAAIDVSIDKSIKVIQTLRQFGNPAIIDLGSGLNRTSAEVIDKVDRLLYVIEASAVALEMAKSQLQVFDDLIGGGRISVVVVNRSQSTLPWHEAENRLNREVKAIISPAPELAFQAIEQATPMVMLQPNAMVSGQFIKLADELKSRIRSIANE
ncbi:MAG: response regulator [Phototrophicaceae bacterium]